MPVLRSMLLLAQVYVSFVILIRTSDGQLSLIGYRCQVAANVIGEQSGVGCSALVRWKRPSRSSPCGSVAFLEA